MKKNFFISSIVLSLLLVISILFSVLNPTKITHKDYKLMESATTKTQECFDLIKEYKIANGFKLDKKDIYESYMLGSLMSDITTTDGILESKLTSINPNFAALFIKLFREANLNKNDQVSILCSGSFICFNIACIVACDIYGLDYFIMASVGSSSYGANDPSFNNIDIINYLYSKGMIKNNVELASLGGFKDIGYDFEEETKTTIRDRIKSYNIDYYEESDFNKNILYRESLLDSKMPQMKLFINIGGTSTGIGLGGTFGEKYGLIKASEYNIHNSNNKNIGLLDVYLNKGVNVLHLLNVKGLCTKYGMIYNPLLIPSINDEDCYYDVSYNLTLPIVSLSITIIYLVCYYLDKKGVLKHEKNKE